VSYRWDFGDGAREVLPVVPHTYATPGTYRARLTVTDSAGVTAVAEQLISVGIPRPQITFRQPPANVTNLVLSPASPLWVVAETVVTPGVARTTLAGLDRDRDACDAIAVLYASQTGIEKERLGDLSDAVSAVAFSPNGQFFAVATADGQIQVFNAATARPLNQMNVGVAGRHAAGCRARQRRGAGSQPRHRPAGV
jgi:PKD repeat protein